MRREAMRIVSARWVVPVDRPPIAEGALALDAAGTVRAVGPRAEVRAELPAAPEERALGVLVPGLVNAHCHLELSALAEAVPGGGGFIAWAQRFLKTVGETPRERRRAAAHEAAEAAVRLGTAAIGDVGNTLDAAPALGAAALAGVLFHELLGSREARTGDALADAARERAEAAAWPAALGYVRAPHAPYSVGPELMRRIFAAARADGRATSVHVAEDVEELKLLRDGTGAWPAMLAAMGIDAATRAPGQTPVEYLASLGAFDGGAPPLLVHMVHAGDDDRRRARAAGATAVLCPRSNLHIGGLLPDVPALLDDGVSIALGTDSLASTPDLSVWGEMATLAGHFPTVPAARWLEAATSGGARAIGLPAHGALAPGKRPGVLDVLVDDLAAPVEALVRDPSPPLRWVARA
ncbi:MAG TPA: amidohydrolase family protein [Polyangia bacterium]|nr:amidohydrolase family protein [Polyangia bacterium]